MWNGYKREWVGEWMSEWMKTSKGPCMDHCWSFWQIDGCYWTLLSFFPHPGSTQLETTFPSPLQAPSPPTCDNVAKFSSQWDVGRSDCNFQFYNLKDTCSVLYPPWLPAHQKWSQLEQSWKPYTEDSKAALPIRVTAWPWGAEYSTEEVRPSFLEVETLHQYLWEPAEQG